MKRFQELILAATPGRKPWESVPEEAIAKVAALCSPADIADIVAELEALAEEKATLPAWDGDAQDDIGRAQELFVSILGALPEALSPVLQRFLSTVSEATRKWVELRDRKIGWTDGGR